MARREGFLRVRVDGEIYMLDEDEIKLDKNIKHYIEIIVDRLVIKEGIRERLSDSVETTLQQGEGIVVIDVIDGEQYIFSEKFACPDCGISLPELSPRVFSFNSPYGACPACDGLGFKKEFAPDLILDWDKSLADGGIIPWRDSSSKYYPQVLEALAQEHDFSIYTPLKELGEEVIDIILYGSDRLLSFPYTNRYGRTRQHDTYWEGIINHLKRRLSETDSEYVQKRMDSYMSEHFCSECKGQKLKPEVLAVTVGGLSIMDFTKMNIREASNFLDRLDLDERSAYIAAEILKEIKARLNFLINVGLNYLTLDRAAGTLSGGEAQRIRLATQIGSGLVGVLYILDEPSIGLHQRDNDKLIRTLEHIRDIGNTVIVVEHDEDTMRAADYIIDIGPGAGKHGGYIVAQGTPEEIMNNEDFVTGRYLSGKERIPVPEERYMPNGKYLEVIGARQHNLKNIDVKIPLGTFTCVTGVSGSGKSTLINNILYRKLMEHFYGSTLRPGEHDEIKGLEHLDKVINIDQSPIGRTPRSNPATYTKVFDQIRDVFAMTQEARRRGYSKGRFSFNVKGGRCEACKGDGIIKIEMHFLPDVYVPCEICKGKRYNRETLEVRYKGKNISDVLEMTIEDGCEFFKNIPKIHRKVQTLVDVGLGYMKLGQPATTISGGEAQRVKLASELYRRSTGKMLYILDEPTTGLHTDDIDRLLIVLHRLVDSGETVLVIEHNLDVIKTADYLIDLGPEGGHGGGTIIASGTPEQIIKAKGSYTGAYLKPVLERDRLRTENLADMINMG